MRLPSTLSRFYHLKFLDLDGWNGHSDLPEDFSHLENLHDFHATSKLHSNIRNVGKMKHLQELKEFHVRNGSMGFELSELGALTELQGGLIIRGIEHVSNKEEATAAKLKLKKNMKELELLWGRDGATTDADILDALQPHSNLRALIIANHGGTVGPSWLCLDIWLASLETLTLEGVSWSTLPPFAKLPNLKGLKLKKISGMHQFGLRCGGTPGKCSMRLNIIEFYEMPELVEWAVEPNCHSLTSIEEIICIDCPNVCVMPFSEVSCTNLRGLQVSGCPKMSLPSMPHTSTLTDLDVKRGDSETLLSYDGKLLVVRGYGDALAYHNMDKLEDMVIENVSCISMQFPSSSSLQKLSFRDCKGLVLVPVENGGEIQEDNSLLQSLTIWGCGELFCRWPMAMGESKTIYPFPASLRKLDVWGEQSMKSMALLSNLTSLTSLSLIRCSNLTVEGFNPLIIVNLKELQVTSNNTLAADLLSKVARTKLLPAGYISRLEKLIVDNICGLLVAPICSLLAPTLHTLEFQYDGRMKSLTEEQEKALQLLTSLEKLHFLWCYGLQSLPQGLHRLPSLKELHVVGCLKIQSMPKEGLPVSLRKLEMNWRSAEIDEQIEKIKEPTHIYPSKNN
ncbi:unnamed protein product [Triticum turgidum subsp. durum]|uniref:R13L1/DRL21-like LRR repeat region domain-containing protein n=1 Tax=Triticum turgidum subsp. durum TaxID=4567 RepID=A0A9R0WWK7_TRITD|nr:unnamed protein product [Triticum turgidum subsp. durum]